MSYEPRRSSACRRRLAAASMLLMMLSATSCSQESHQSGNSGNEPPTRVLTVSVAASTEDAMREACERFTQETGVGVVLNAGPTNALSNQILAGAPAELLLAAHPRWVEVLDDQQLVAGSVTLLGNQLVLVVPSGNPANVKRLEDLLDGGVRHVALAGENVPAGAYADQALARLGLAQPLIEQGKIVRGHDVRATLSYVERGEVEAGIVYATDAAVSDDVQQVVTLDPQLHEPIHYPLVLLQSNSEASAAAHLFAYLQSAAAAAVFRRHGFLTQVDGGT